VSYLRTYHPNPGAELRLVCFPHAGGSATGFRGWTDSLPPWIELICVQYPGRQDRIGEPYAADIPVLVAEIVAELPTGRPLALFGHSLGATVAFEVARALEKGGRTRPVQLFLSAPAAAGALALDISTDERLLAEVRRLGGTGVALLEHPELRQMVLPTIRHDLAILAAHEITEGPPLDCPITVLVGESDHTCQVPDGRRWAPRTTGEFDLRVFPGGHHYLDEAQARTTVLLAEKLRMFRRAS
jgi:pyochelin biosynthetic protein PchC